MKIDKIEKDNTVFFTPLEFRKKYKINLFFTSRKGGYSEGKYDSLNMSHNVKDNTGNVIKNRGIAENFLGFNNKDKKLISLEQVHSNKIIKIDDIFFKNNPRPVKNTPSVSSKGIIKTPADGLITNQCSIPLMVMGADCNLILIADIKNRTVSAVHAGWRGLLKKIDLKAIEMFKSGYGSNLKDVYIFIGPSIRKCCFKVSGETYDLFFKQYKYNLPAEKEKNESGHTGYYFIDLAMIIKNNMASAGIPENNISDTGLCTCCNTDNLFFSYRKENITGRHAGIIMLE